jgi:hypothetical protein
MQGYRRVEKALLHEGNSGDRLRGMLMGGQKREEENTI